MVQSLRQLSGSAIQGTQGASGSTGFTGATGVQGASGSTGIQGASGSTGIQGASGSTGFQGASGATGNVNTYTIQFGPQIGSTGATGSVQIYGSLQVGTGATGATGSITTSGDITVGGNLTVNGTTTTVNSTTLTVDDKNIELGTVAVPSDTTADAGGITLKGATDKTIIWQATATTGGTNTGYWNATENWNLSGTNKAYYINGVSVLNQNTLGSGITASSLTSLGTIATLSAGTIGASGVTTNTLTLGGASIPSNVGASGIYAGTDDTSTATATYPTFFTSTSGVSKQELRLSSTRLTYVPSTGTFSALAFGATGVTAVTLVGTNAALQTLEVGTGATGATGSITASGNITGAAGSFTTIGATGVTVSTGTVASAPTNTVPALALTGTPNNATGGKTGVLGVGTNFTASDKNIIASFVQSINDYTQIIVQNPNTGTAASADFVVNNDNTTGSGTYGDFGINSSTFTGTGSISLANATYFYSNGGDLVLGTNTANIVRFVINNSATDIGTITSTGLNFLALGATGVTTNTLVSTNAAVQTIEVGTGATGATGTISALRGNINNIGATGITAATFTGGTVAATTIGATGITITTVTAGNVSSSTIQAGTGATGATGTITDSLGEMRTIVQNTQSTGTYNLVATDAGKHINVTGAVTVNFPVSIFSAGQAVTVVNNTASSISITGATGSTIYLAGTATTGTRTLAQRGITTGLVVTGGAAPVIIMSGAGLT